jgi:hypothetical protein
LNSYFLFSFILYIGIHNIYTAPSARSPISLSIHTIVGVLAFWLDAL